LELSHFLRKPSHFFGSDLELSSFSPKSFAGPRSIAGDSRKGLQNAYLFAKIRCRDCRERTLQNSSDLQSPGL
jgi:hypothetical protein